MQPQIINCCLHKQFTHFAKKVSVASQTYSPVRKKNLHWLDLIWSKGMACSCKYCTRSFHHFASDNVGVLKFKQVSVETSFCGFHSFPSAVPAMCISDVATMSYVSCIYDGG